MPQDIEWAIDRHVGELFILQSRPETVWSNRPRPQAATGDAMSLITATMLGSAAKPKE